MNEGWPNVYDLDTDQEHTEAGDRLKRWRGVVESFLGHPDLQAPEDQDAMRREMAGTDRQLEMWAASRTRRRDFLRRGMIRE